MVRLETRPHVKASRVLRGGDTGDSRVIHSLRELPGPKGTEDRPGVSSPKAELPEGHRGPPVGDVGRGLGVLSALRLLVLT